MQRENNEAASAFRVLVVEDELLIAMELQAVLAGAGFLVVGPASTVSDALDSLKEEPPHAAVLDVNLRGEKVTPVAEALLLLQVPYVLASACGAADLAGEPSLAQARNLGKPTADAALVGVMKEFFKGATP